MHLQIMGGRQWVNSVVVGRDQCCALSCGAESSRTAKRRGECAFALAAPNKSAIAYACRTLLRSAPNMRPHATNNKHCETRQEAPIDRLIRLIATIEVESYLREVRALRNEQPKRSPCEE